MREYFEGIKRGDNMKNDELGQVTLEAAIAFTVTLVFLASVISSINLYRTDILMRRSCEQTCEKMSLLYPLSVPATDLVSSAVNAFPDLGIGDTKGADVLSKVASVGAGIDNATGHTLEELILQGIFSHTMEEQIREGFAERNGGSDFFAPDDIQVFFEVSDEHHIIEVTTEYSVATIAGRKSRSIYSVIPLYGEQMLLLQGEGSAAKDEEKKDNIWSLSNFDRGDAFRERYGANLPKTFPVIDKVEGGEITAIRSIDPQSANINGNTYSVDYISSRHLTVIIPENSGSAGREAVEELKGYAFVKGVILDVCEYGTSDRYSGG